MEVGYHLNETEIADLINSFEGNQKFHNLVQEMNKYGVYELPLAEAEVVQGLKFDTTKDAHVITGKGLVLKINDNVELRYITRYFNGDIETKKDFFVGKILNTEEPGMIKQLILRASDERTVSIRESEYDQEAVAAASVLDDKFNQEFNFDENYQPGQLVEQVDAQSPVKGCIAGGYIYCGDSCGGYPACAGSKSGINSTDNCCKTHDCCYTYNGVSYPNCYCDQRLCDCVQNSPAYGADIIIETAFCFVC